MYNLEANSKCRVIARIDKTGLSSVVFDSRDDRFESVVLKGDEVLLSTFELNAKEKQQLLKIMTANKEKTYKINNKKFFISMSESNIYDMRAVNLVTVHNQGWTLMIMWQYISILLLFWLVNILYYMSNLKIYRPIKNIFEKYNNLGGEVELIDKLLAQVSENIIEKEGEKNKLSKILQRNNFYNLCYNDGKDVDWNIMRELTVGFDYMVMLYIVFEDDFGSKNHASSEKFYGILRENYKVLTINRTFDKADVYIVSIKKYEEFCEKLKMICREIYEKSSDNVFITGGLSKAFEEVYKAVDAFKQCEHAIKKQPIKLMDGKTISSFEEYIYVEKDKKSVEIMAEDSVDSRNQIQRYIRLTNLIDPILEMVDTKEIAMNAAVELSYLGSKAQHDVLEAMESEDAAPSIEQAKKIRRFNDEERLNPDVILSIMQEQKPEKLKITLGDEQIKKYFPKSFTKKQMEDTIIKLLENWHRMQNGKRIRQNPQIRMTKSWQKTPVTSQTRKRK